jgi:hypothetical protein
MRSAAVLLLTGLLLAAPIPAAAVEAQSGPEADHDCVRATVLAPLRDDGLVHAETKWGCHNGTGAAGRIIGEAASAELQVKRDGVHWIVVARAGATRSNAGTVYMPLHAKCVTMLRGAKPWRTVHRHASAVRYDHQAVIRGATAGATRYLPCA